MTATATPAQDHASAAPALPAAGSSFYTAMRLLPKERREAMYAVYAFCRAVDDVADDGGTRAVRQVELDRWRADIDALYAGRPAPRPEPAPQLYMAIGVAVVFALVAGFSFVLPPVIAKVPPSARDARRAFCVASPRSACSKKPFERRTTLATRTARIAALTAARRSTTPRTTHSIRRTTPRAAARARAASSTPRRGPHPRRHN